MMNMIKRMFAALLVTVFAFTLVPTSAFAAEAPRSFNDQLKKDIVDIVRNNKKNAVEELFKNRLAKESGFQQRINGNMTRSGKVGKLESSEKVDNDTMIDFYSSGVFLISTAGIVDTSAIGAASTLPISNEALSPMATTSTVYTTTRYTAYAAYGVLGQLLWDTYLSGYFAYDTNKNVTPTPYLDRAYYVRGPVSLWQVSNWSTGGTRLLNSLTAYCYARGNFHWGFEVEGVGIVVQDIALDLRLTCDKTGHVTGNGNH